MRLDVLYVEGPGDIVAAFESWRAGREHASETSVTFSSQLFAHCRERNESLMALSYCARKTSVRAGDWLVENLPRPMLRVPKIGYHLSLFLYALRIGARALRYRPRLILLTSGVVTWTMARMLRLTGATVVPILHNALWPEGFGPATPGLDLAWWRSRRPPPTLVVSPAIRRQLDSLSARAGASAVEFRPSFAASEFPLPIPAEHGARPFRVLFVGRIEIEKGALDLIPIAHALKTADPGAFHFDVCGHGSQAGALARAVREHGLDDTVTIHGRLDRAALIKRYRAAHVCIVPTRSSFSEGFAMVVAESILLGRPVVTSPVVPASEPYRNAVSLAWTDDVSSYVSVLAKLATDADAYRRLADACVALRPDILRRDTSFQSALRTLEAGLDGPRERRA